MKSLSPTTCSLKYSQKGSNSLTLKLLISLLGILTVSCNKLVEVKPPIVGTSSSVVYQNDASAIAVVNGIYTQMFQQGINTGITSLSLCAGLSSDELVVYNNVNDPVLTSFYTNTLTPTLTGAFDYWSSIYSNQIFTINSVIEGLNSSISLTPAVKKQLLGEVKFLRAFCFFYLTNLYGDIPLVLTSDYTLNSKIGRSIQTEVYKQIVSDLKEAEILLNENYLNSTLLSASDERVAPNKYAATSLLARVYLFIGEWQQAESHASQVISNQALYDTVPLQDVFLINNRESIWQLQSVSNTVTNTSDALLFILPSTGPNSFPNTVYLSDSLAYSFEAGDNRRANWIDSVIVDNITYFYPTKYKSNILQSPPQERTSILRLSEQYLIRSEARIRLGDITGGLSDLNIIRVRAGLSPILNASNETALSLVLRERRLELFLEWGHRWFDLKRTLNADNVLSKTKAPNWQSTDQLYPIPASELNRNSTLVGHQNPGY
ncbi:RagB/SusD family nutrient uptake outer membrane protein [Chitinophaga tropicalis]|uniref:RagB/SusD family nutrient uptake outer membrane protein n=1 Tax=Chitinophaga tropicalis TaxID=2683588 RepID=A0A7K1UBV0_9BACT|nr:RagB/SusD family nutrient uptake outer membrane protein [Chitinophaga tropicalis]MVT11869.1 RagB/SusD family nutrient uptake outer membrane protein [Chitinophaga tropicalis]